MTINDTNVMSLDSPGSMGLDFSGTFYGMLNPLLCDTKCIDFLGEFKEAEKPAAKTEKRNVSYKNVLISALYYQLKSGSLVKARSTYDKILIEIAKDAYKKGELDNAELKETAKKLIEQQLCINLEEEFQKCSDRAINYSSRRLKSAPKKPERETKYTTSSEITRGSKVSAPINNTVRKSFKLSQKLMTVPETSEVIEGCANAWDSAASVLGTSKFFAFSLAAAWIAVICSSCN